MEKTLISPKRLSVSPKMNPVLVRFNHVSDDGTKFSDICERTNLILLPKK